MRAVLQKVAFAKVVIDNKDIVNIDKGIVALVGLSSSDNEDTFKYMLDKIINLRIFEDDNGKMNLSINDIDGEVLFIPNFTIYADVRKGRRPGFTNGATIEEAKEIFEKLKEFSIKNYKDKIKFGIFQTDTKLTLLNDGPVTILVDSDKIF